VADFRPSPARACDPRPLAPATLARSCLRPSPARACDPRPLVPAALARRRQRPSPAGASGPRFLDVVQCGMRFAHSALHNIQPRARRSRAG